MTLSLAPLYPDSNPHLEYYTDHPGHFSDYKIIGFWREEVLRSNLAIPILPTVRTLQPRDVILEAVKHLKIPLGSEVHKTDPTAQIF